MALMRIGLAYRLFPVMALQALLAGNGRNRLQNAPIATV
jgi:hypothetical protein